jgi:hypothetical protein
VVHQADALARERVEQNPIRDGGIIKSALVVCPASLVQVQLRRAHQGHGAAAHPHPRREGPCGQNWHREFKKWLGDERIRTYAAIPSASLHEYMATSNYPVLIIGYERVRTCVPLGRTVRSVSTIPWCVSVSAGLGGAGQGRLWPRRV